MGRTVMSTLFAAMRSGSLAVMGILILALPVLLYMQISLPFGQKPLNWIAHQVAMMDYIEGQGQIEIHARQRQIDIRLDEIDIINKKLAEIQGQLNADEKWWDTNCGLVNFFSPDLGSACNELRDMRYGPAFGSVDHEHDRLRNRLRELEQEVLMLRTGQPLAALDKGVLIS